MTITKQLQRFGNRKQNNNNNNNTNSNDGNKSSNNNNKNTNQNNTMNFSVENDEQLQQLLANDDVEQQQQPHNHQHHNRKNKSRQSNNNSNHTDNGSNNGSKSLKYEQLTNRRMQQQQQQQPLEQQLNNTKHWSLLATTNDDENVERGLLAATATTAAATTTLTTPRKMGTTTTTAKTPTSTTSCSPSTTSSNSSSIIFSKSLLTQCNYDDEHQKQPQQQQQRQRHQRAMPPDGMLHATTAATVEHDNEVISEQEITDRTYKQQQHNRHQHQHHHHQPHQHQHQQRQQQQRHQAILKLGSVGSNIENAINSNNGNDIVALQQQQQHQQHFGNDINATATTTIGNMPSLKFLSGTPTPATPTTTPNGATNLLSLNTTTASAARTATTTATTPHALLQQHSPAASHTSATSLISNNSGSSNSMASSTTTAGVASTLSSSSSLLSKSFAAAAAATAAAATTPTAATSTTIITSATKSTKATSACTASNGSGSGGSGGGAGIACNCCSNLIARCCFGLPILKAINVRRCVLALFAITVVTILYYTHYMDTGVFVGLIQRDTRPSPLINCRMASGGGSGSGGGTGGASANSIMGVSGKHGRIASAAPDHRSAARLRIDAKVLVFVETTYTGLGRDIAELLVYNRIKYKIEVAGKSLPVLTNLDKGRYGVIVFENLDKYLHMDKWNRELLDKYCREYSVGIVGFVSPSEETLVAAQLRGLPLYVHTNLRLRDASLNGDSPVLRLTRAGETAWGPLPGDDWAVFQHNHSTYEPIEWAQRNTQDYPSDGGGQMQVPLTTVLQDHGRFDGIQRVLFGSSLRFWLHRLLFLDALSYLSHGQLSLSLERMLLVDIDDIFVGEKGTRLRPDDVRALIATQKIIAAMVPGFRFNLGFSGKYYHHGTREENLGDDFLLQHVEEFTWFSHMWKHQQPHLYDNLTLLIAEMQLNYGFAREHNIPTDSGYSISPHHSGVYPAHELLYVAWKKVWNVRVTSTEEYPHLRPARLRRGFIHRGIMVLPRQTCGLFTHTMYIDRYPGGRDKLDESIQGGELFQTIVYNPINIFMTHMSNYGSDRLALYTFQSVIKFLQCWTNLKLASAPPLQLAETYFRLHPEEVDPVWGNPCDDVRHRKIWSKTKSCDALPKFLVIGPQKTGTTALYTFLSMHSSIASNVPSPDTFEEIQFFNGNNYYRGLDWYMDFFPSSSNGGVGEMVNNSSATAVSTATTTTRYMFEKSATYFDGEAVPRRAHALLPHAKIVAILISPAKRAYSWYQHQRAHGDAIANNYSFYQVITAGDSATKALKDLRNRCLNPGKYAQHLEHWLAYYPAQQLHIIDGEQLRLNPMDVMNDLQRFLKIQPTFDYSNHLRYDVKKGFFCQVINEKHNKCLGKSKGRQYPPMDERSVKLLQRYYLTHNTALVKLLKKLGSRPIPQWLKDDLSMGT